MDNPKPFYRIGVDVGGTNTDAVLISLKPMQIIASQKTLTTPDVTTGIKNAVQGILQSSGVSTGSIACINIGTTHFVNAIVQRSPSLRRVAVLRLCGGPDDGFGRGLPPFIDFPIDLRQKIEARTFSCHGGYQISGEEISALDESEILSCAEMLHADGIGDIVISGMYSPMNNKQELQVKELILRRMGELAGMIRPRITLSHEISQLGFLARENASILNATLRPLAEKTIQGFQQAKRELFDVKGDRCALFLTQNDGSVISARDAIELPIRTFNSGPTNSIRGGEFLWRSAAGGESGDAFKREDALVVIDIGGTTSDSRLLLPNGLPRKSSLISFVGGVRTGFTAPAVESIGLGGGSIINVKDSGKCVTVGPESVGHELLQRATLFGGDQLTATDIAVASRNDRDAFGTLADLSRLANLDSGTIEIATLDMRKMLAELVDRTKFQKGDVDVLIVGGGALLIDPNEPIEGVRTLRTVEGGEVANAVGAAIARVSTVIDTFMDVSRRPVKDAQDEVCRMAKERAVQQGAVAETVEVAEIDILPVQYVDNKARIVVTVVGELDAMADYESQDGDIVSSGDLEEAYEELKGPPGAQLESLSDSRTDLQTYRPFIEREEWIVSQLDLEFIAAGCRILGCGGGGDPYQQYLKAKAMLLEHPGSIRIVSPEHLTDDGLIGWTGGLGAPEVTTERLENDECLKAYQELARTSGKGPVSAFMAVEIGGGNGCVNLVVAAQCGVPCVDADFMGRAYPTAYQVTTNVYGSEKGEAMVPMVLASGDGTFVSLNSTRTDRLVDKVLRAACVEMGCSAGCAGPLKSGQQVKQQAIPNTVSLAWWIGRAVSMEKTTEDRIARIVEAAGGSSSSVVLAQGKVTAVERVLKKGHSYGVLMVDASLGDGSKANVQVPFKNENAYVEAKSPSGQSRILASVPDLIAVIDVETGVGLGTPEYRFGLKVAIVAIAASRHWTDSKRGMELGGPSSMGFDDVKYEPIGQYAAPRSVIDVFG